MADLERMIEPGRMLLIGEVHGTNEYPALVAAIAAAAVARDCPVTVALEIPASEQSRIEIFLDSEGTPGDRAALTASSFWNTAAELADGRSSRAMVALLDRLRELRGGPPDERVHVVALDGATFDIDVSAMSAGPGETVFTPAQYRAMAGNRDVVMAERLINAMRGFTVALLGNAHVPIVRDGPGGYVPLGWHVAERVAATISLLGTSDGGTFWAITDPERGGSVQVMNDRQAGAVGAKWGNRPNQRGYHGTVHVGAITASPPASTPL